VTGLLLVAPILLGLLPGRLDELLIGVRCRRVLEEVARHQRAHGRPPAELAIGQLPPGCVYRYDPVGNTFTLFFSRPSLPSIVVYYHSATGWGAHD
jgi:hypothetical protein